MENVHMDNALKRTFNLDPCVILKQSSKLEKCAKDTSAPFYVAEVISNNTDGLTVQRWSPSVGKGGKYHNNAFEAQATKHRIQNTQKGAPHWRLKPYLNNVKYNTVYFGFSKMTRDRRLPAEVLRKL